MSLNAAVRTPRITPTSAPAPSRPRLEAVPAAAPRRRPKLVYALVALAGAVAIGAAQIGLSLAITQDSYTLASLTAEQHELDLRSQALQEELTGTSSPQALATSAAGLGMIVAGSPSYLRLSDGAVLGSGTGSGSTSTVDPNGAGAVSNSLLVPPAAADANDAPVTEQPDQDAEQLPPAITDGLPSPTTH